MGWGGGVGGGGVQSQKCVYSSPVLVQMSAYRSGPLNVDVLNVQAGISQSYTTKHDSTKQQADIHPRTQEYMELRLHQHFATHSDRSYGLHKATNHILHRIRTAKTMVPKKAQKCRNTGSSCLHKFVLGQRAMKQRILGYRKAPVTQAKRSSLFHCSRVLLFHSFACFDTTPVCSHLRRVELKDRISPNKAQPPNPHTRR